MMSDQAHGPYAQKRILETSNQSASEGSDDAEVIAKAKDERGPYAAFEKLTLITGLETLSQNISNGRNE